jgi:hypothetical protein
VVGQQSHLERALVQERRRQRLDALPDRRAGGRDGIDRVRLARRALVAARAAGQLRRDAHDPFAVSDQRALQTRGDLPAVLDRPHPLRVEHVRPPPRPEHPAHVGAHRTHRDHTARGRVQCRQRMRALVRIHPDHDHAHRPLHRHR